MSKFVKLLGHYIRHPIDFLLLPVSIIFGYLHGLIKAKAMLSLDAVSPMHQFSSRCHDVSNGARMPRSIALLMLFTQTAWGTRDGADDDDGNRMIPFNRKKQEASTAFSIPETSSYQNEKCEYRPSFPRCPAV